MDELHDASHDGAQSTPVWAIFSDLMAALVGIFVLLLVWVIGIQLELSQSLEEERAKLQAEQERRTVERDQEAAPRRIGLGIHRLHPEQSCDQEREQQQTCLPGRAVHGQTLVMRGPALRDYHDDPDGSHQSMQVVLPVHPRGDHKGC